LISLAEGAGELGASVDDIAGGVNGWRRGDALSGENADGGRKLLSTFSLRCRIQLAPSASLRSRMIAVAKTASGPLSIRKDQQLLNSYSLAGAVKPPQ